MSLGPGSIPYGSLQVPKPSGHLPGRGQSAEKLAKTCCLTFKKLIHILSANNSSTDLLAGVVQHLRSLYCGGTMRLCPYVLRLLLAVALFLSLGNLCLAQFRATIQGTITDPQGAAVGAAHVKVEDQATG